MMHKTYRPSPDALLDPCFDEVFKALFTHNSPESRGALTDFLSNLLNKKIARLSLLPNEPPVSDDRDKQTRFDIACTFNDGKTADIEMQGRNENTAYERRAEYLCARLLNFVVPSGMDWQNIPQVFQISLVGFNVDLKDEEPISWFQMRKETGEHLSGTMNIVFVELPKIRKMLREQGEIPPENLPKIIKWCIFLSEAGNPKMADYINQLVKTEDGIMQAHNVLRKISTSDALWKKELDEEVVARDRSSFIHAWQDKAKAAQKVAEDAERKAAATVKESEEKIAATVKESEEKIAATVKESENKTREIARSLKAAGVPVKTIAQCTGLSEKVCLNLK